jgi:hypothetical protein
MAIWDEHSEVARALPMLALSFQTLLMRSASCSLHRTGDQRPMCSRSLLNLPAASCASGYPGERLCCTATRPLSPRLEDHYGYEHVFARPWWSLPAADRPATHGQRLAEA